MLETSRLTCPSPLSCLCSKLLSEGGATLRFQTYEEHMRLLRQRAMGRHVPSNGQGLANGPTGPGSAANTPGQQGMEEPLTRGPNNDKDGTCT